MLCPECEANICVFSSSNEVEVSNGVTEFNVGRICVDACPECYFKVEGSLNASKQTDIYISHADKQIAAYGKEIYCDNIHTLNADELIESHRRLREWYIKQNTDDRKIRLDMENKAYDDAYKHAMKNQFLSREQLLSMTIYEFSDFISGRNNG